MPSSTAPPSRPSLAITVTLTAIGDLTSAFPPYPDHSISCISATEAFNTGLDIRDQARCVVCDCDVPGCVAHCHILGRNGPGVENQWQWLKANGVIPQRAKSHQHESRNGIMMCLNHHKSFNDLHWFVRFMPTRHQYVFVNISNHPKLAPFHDQPLNLNPDDTRAPFPAAFALHEMRARVQYFYMHPMITDYSPDDDNDDGGGDGNYGDEIDDDGDDDDDNVGDDTNMDMDYMEREDNGEDDRQRTVIPTDFKPSQPSNDSLDPALTVLENPESSTAPAFPSASSMVSYSNRSPLPSPPSSPGPSQHHPYARNHNKRRHHRQPIARQIILPPISFDDPATRAFFSRDNMLALGFRNWTACEAEGSTNEDTVDRTEGSDNRHIQGMTREDVRSWVMRTEPGLQG